MISYSLIQIGCTISAKLDVLIHLIVIYRGPQTMFIFPSTLTTKLTVRWGTFRRVAEGAVLQRAPGDGGAEGAVLQRAPGDGGAEGAVLQRAPGDGGGSPP